MAIMVLHMGTGTYFDLDDGVILIDTDTLTTEQKWEWSESGEVPDGVGGEDLLSLLPLRYFDAIYPGMDGDDDRVISQFCLVCGQPDNCGDCDHTPVPPEAYGG